MDRQHDIFPLPFEGSPKAKHVDHTGLGLSSDFSDESNQVRFKRWEADAVFSLNSLAGRGHTSSPSHRETEAQTRTLSHIKECFAAIPPDIFDERSDE